MTWKRARSEAQKEQRIAAIVEATARLYDALTFEGITYARIAKEAKFTRSNLYKYFSTKEEILLALLGQDLIRFRQSLARTLRPGKVSSAAECAAVWTRALIRHERLLRLLSILYTSLEKNASLESLTQFKRTAKEELTALAQLLGGVFPSLTPEKVEAFLHMQGALAIGLYPAAHLSEVQREAMARAGFERIGIDFRAHLRDGIEYLLQGLV